MNSVNFTVFLSMRNILRKIVIDFQYYNESISAETEDRTLEEGFDIQLETVKFYNETGSETDNKTIQRIIIPQKLMNAAVFGISEEGSTRSAKRLAWAKLLNVKKVYSSSDAASTVDLSDIDYIIISGGYDDSVNNRLNSMITYLGKNPQLLEFKPHIIFAGSRLSLETAKKELAKPGIHFSAQANALETESYTAGDDSIYQNTLPAIRQMTFWDNNEDFKINDISYTQALREVSDVFCMKRFETVLSVLLTDDYSLLSHAEKDIGTTAFKNYAVPQKAETLSQELFESVFNDLFIEKRTVFDENFTQNDVLPIDNTEKEAVFFEPDRIIGITLTEKISFETFIKLVCIPKITHGTIYFLFDNQGVILAAMTLFLKQRKEAFSFLRGFFNTKDIMNGWIFIPYGRFKKGVPAIYIEKLENDGKEDIVIRWGEYRIIDLNPNSVAEIHTINGVYMTKDLLNSNKKTIGTKESRKTLIFDLREEMHKWKV